MENENTSKLSVAIFGAGSIGCYLGGQLASGGAHVTFIGRERFRDECKSAGLTLTHFERDPLLIPPESFDFSLDPSGAATSDIVLVCVKSQDSAAAAESLAPHLRDNALIISFQNGLRNADVLTAGLHGHKVLGGVVPFNVTGKGPGAFHSGTEGDLIVQDIADARLDRLKATFSESGQVLKTVPDIKAVQWGKLLVNLNNGLNTLSGGTLHEGLSQRAYRQAMARMMEEALGVLKTAGIEPAQFGKASVQQTMKILKQPNFVFKIVMALVLKIDKTARSSMLDDLEMGRGTEIDYLQGEIVELAEKTGQSAPINQVVMNRVKAAFRDGVSPKMSGAQILALCC